jgi:hypothetical protein
MQYVSCRYLRWVVYTTGSQDAGGHIRLGLNCIPLFQPPLLPEAVIPQPLARPTERDDWPRQGDPPIALEGL